MAKIRIYEWAKIIGEPSNVIVSELKEAGIQVRNHTSSVERVILEGVYPEGIQTQQPEEVKSENVIEKKIKSPSVEKELTQKDQEVAEISNVEVPSEVQEDVKNEVKEDVKNEVKEDVQVEVPAEVKVEAVVEKVQKSDEVVQKSSPYPPPTTKKLAKKTPIS